MLFRGKIEDIEKKVIFTSKKILVLISKNVSKKKRIDYLLKKLKKKNKVDIFNSIKAGAYLNDLKKIIKFQVPDVILAIGGGSVIDIAKALSCTMKSGKIRQDTLSKFNNKIELIVIPTVSGTGSETSKGAILQYESGKKFALRSPALIPNKVYLDFSLCLTAPKKLRSECLFDCLSHALETFISKKASLKVKKRSIKVIKNLLNLNYKKIDFLRNQKIISESSYLMGKNLAESTTCLPHRIQYSLSKFSKCTHAQGIISIYKGWVPKIKKDKSFLVLQKTLNQKNNLADQIINFKKEMKINYSLKNFNITKKYFNKITQSTSGTLENDPIYKNKQDIKEILKQSL